MLSILFLRKVRRLSGGQIKVRDYFEHCLRHPALQPSVYFTPDSKPDAGLWADVPAARRISEVDVDKFDLLFVEGRDWRLLPDDVDGNKVINLIQGVRHADPTDPRFAYLSRPALRICVSDEVRAAIASSASGEVVVIPPGVPLELFESNAGAKAEASVLIWSRKNQSLGTRLCEALRGRGARVTLLDRYLPREEFAARLANSDIFVGLPLKREGFYLPALEAMAAGCAVVCSDAVGNRRHCVAEKTCLMPRFDDLADHVGAVERLLSDRGLRDRLRADARELSQSYSLARERAAFHALLERARPELAGGSLASAEQAQR